MPPAIKKILESFGVAVLYCFHPRVIALSMVPFITVSVLAFTWSHFHWTGAIESIRASLQEFETVKDLIHWLTGLGMSGVDTLLASAVLLALVVPVIVIATLLLVALFMTPVMVAMIAAKRFPKLERNKGGSWMGSLMWSIGSTAIASVLMLVSIPFWWVPPVILVVPPLIWGWLTFRVMSYDALANYATVQERGEIFKEHQVPLLAMGVISGYLGATPSLLWASGAVFVALAPVLLPLALWLYTLVFILSSLWFAHYTLGALEALRKKKSAPPPAPPPKPEPVKFIMHLEPAPVPPPPPKPAPAPAPPPAPAAPPARRPGLFDRLRRKR
jgi:hypothetical protein